MNDKQDAGSVKRQKTAENKGWFEDADDAQKAGSDGDDFFAANLDPEENITDNYAKNWISLDNCDKVS